MRSRLYRRLLIVALLVLFLPVAGVWSLASFERELLAAEERAMAAQARTVAAWLAEPLSSASVTGDSARAALRGIERPLLGRLRVIATDGSLLADTADAPSAPASKLGGSSLRDRPLYRLGALLWRVRRAFGAGAAKGEAGESGDGMAIVAALGGEYGAVTRPSLDGTDTVLTVAVPIRATFAGDPVTTPAPSEPAPAGLAAPSSAIVGAVVVSRTTDTVLAALDRIRIDLFRVVLLSLVATFLIALLLARGLVLPLLRLRDAADRALRAPGRSADPVPEIERRDEIGEVARALAGLQERLEGRLGQLEALASDLAHELRNPLAAMRSAAELLPGSTSDEERRRLAGLIRTEALRVDRVVTSLQDLARLDAQRTDGNGARSDLAAVAVRVVEVLRRNAPEIQFETILPDTAFSTMPEEAAERVVENLLENAHSFSPPGGRVRLEIARHGSGAEMTIADQGAGIPAEHRERIFDRFFSWRPEGGKAGHLGLGLAIARSLLERHGGAIELAPPVEGFGGACFRVRWPRA